MDLEKLDEKIRKALIFVQMREEAVKKRIKEYWYDKTLQDVEITDPYIPEGYKEDFQIYLGKRNSSTRYKYIMFTVNFREGTTVDHALVKYRKYITKKWIKSHISCLEWRDDDLGMHLHSRVELEDGKNPYECKREVYNTFKNLVGNKLHVNARYSNRDDSFIKYIKGYKSSSPKDSFLATRRMRDKYGVPDLLGTATGVGGASENPRASGRNDRAVPS